ncbi:TetR/AcrR family transcriptional regulator [Microbispora cellulosiformans]|uniref:TetR/AcrR family transcriptional regulator n=1 Tax=Microbispora cellulosiformans TaxID=2614688 RepID=A0A5J5K8F9_9ACTN|nr:TetR/AcrR family transcriptional regulator [Microbispora cellulosiformans]KAA9380699.1 TetR/AcrR family transcriptional regulator [Microbispora cellulosiformans]
MLTVARAAFAADGLDLPVHEIARRAGLGVATVYRHFPSRQDLVRAVLAEQVTACRAQMRAALDDPDPWRALRGTVRRFAEHQVRLRGLNEALHGSHPAGAAFAGQRRAQARGLEQLVERARSAGGVRPGLSVEDVRIGLRAISSFRAGSPESAAVAVGRLTDLLLGGMGRPGP